MSHVKSCIKQLKNKTEEKTLLVLIFLEKALSAFIKFQTSLESWTKQN